ncbi:PREDICTED: isoleucine--tRNA ligase, mitochondrial isoform X1 [Rhagoletis zephyria]|uniref:isoleucine--tRNA ligase, mitochondrial isoform X1 n=1 Tax=Rhagoletis zephyria TaxID=28612 RepID=UPI0008117B82|nr:PREDICTED: isoleucine--tRNA ligase, mitochondrial isoform X1 [Rhagoletis zephyria]XP_017476714.1 PREDICTED: isoleucine--tRNA ligase, mitochondrial isoform X1 [Rhagoletis zephyria]
MFYSRSVRYFSIKQVTKPPIKYTDTINLPKTRFPNRLSAAKRLEIERQLVAGVFSEAYCYQQQHNHEPTFVLHDGPPYANGDLHMGHAVNKILKDITIRQHVVRGQKVHYKPGWDCHGLPIELKATAWKEDKNMKTKAQDALSIRCKSRDFALKAMFRQKDEFCSWGILSDWVNEKSVYLTLQPDFIINQLKMFMDFYERGLVYRDLKPVYWSPSSRTALAEAELEYDTNFVSPSLYVRFLLSNKPKSLTWTEKSNIYALIWTTTPWTLPSNQAICYNSTLEYSVLKLPTFGNDLYIIATSLLPNFEETTGIPYKRVQILGGTELSSCTYQHLFFGEQKNLPFFAAEHVQDSKGTGFVHTAPAHGFEDFLIGLEKKLPVKCYVNEDGVYSSDAPGFLKGKSVLGEADELVLENIATEVIYAGKLTHSYPIDWRTKKPVIIRASEQWFMNTEKLKDRAIEEISKISVYPRVQADASRKALMAQLRKRPYWCISRQRVWGVPIPVFYERGTKRIYLNNTLIDHICELIEKEGSIDFWWSKSVEEILPAHVLDQFNKSATDLEKSVDIFDIWFDSGSTWSSVLQGEKVADVYLEGYDQFSGWFQSSLLTSIAARNRAPYKSIFVHGFTVDEKGHKMSKSLGNVISPNDIIKEYGVDALRWWVASHGAQNMSITVSDKLLQQAAHNVSKIRAILRYLNGVIGEISEEIQNGIDSRSIHLNRYILSALVEYENEIRQLYDACEYNRVVTSVQNFTANEISAIYVHTIKDRLYCGDETDLRNIRYTLLNCYKILCSTLWPIAPFMVEESWHYYDPKSAFHQQNFNASPAWKDSNAEKAINAALEVKRLINQQAGRTNSFNLAVEIEINKNNKQMQLLMALQQEVGVPVYSSELCELLQVQTVTLQPSNMDDACNVKIQKLELNLCARCRRFAVESTDCVCARCAQVLSGK